MNTSESWIKEPLDENGGYDCMTAAIRIGKAVLDGRDYGQENCKDLTLEQRQQMEADASRIESCLKACSGIESPEETILRLFLQLKRAERFIFGQHHPGAAYLLRDINEVLGEVSHLSEGDIFERLTQTQETK